MTLRTAILSVMLFMFALALTLIIILPLHLVVRQVRDHMPEGFKIQSSSGTVAVGKVLISSPLFGQSFPVKWQPCFIDLMHPLGFCLTIKIKTVEFKLAIQPWSLGETIRIYNLELDSELSQLAQLHPSMAVLGAAQGGVRIDIAEVTLTSRRLLDMEGQLQFVDISTLGLEFGTVNTLVTSKVTDDSAAKTIVIDMEGGTMDKIKMQGNGAVNPSGQFKMNFLFQSNNASIQQQLGAVTKKKSDTEFELDYTVQIF